jgi:hypothetical protein
VLLWHAPPDMRVTTAAARNLTAEIHSEYPRLRKLWQSDLSGLTRKHVGSLNAIEPYPVITLASVIYSCEVSSAMNLGDCSSSSCRTTLNCPSETRRGRRIQTPLFALA